MCVQFKAVTESDRHETAVTSSLHPTAIFLSVVNFTCNDTFCNISPECQALPPIGCVDKTVNFRILNQTVYIVTTVLVTLQ
jgi:hypothetical protein